MCGVDLPGAFQSTAPSHVQQGFVGYSSGYALHLPERLGEVSVVVSVQSRTRPNKLNLDPTVPSRSSRITLDPDSPWTITLPAAQAGVEVSIPSTFLVVSRNFFFFFFATVQ